MTGRIVRGINNIFEVLCKDGEIRECRFKGKVLKGVLRQHNPLACGDEVRLSLQEERKGLLLERLPRTNSLGRINLQRKRPQTLAANIDLVIAVASIGTPPLNPGFIDRLLGAANIGGIPSLLIINKSDLKEPQGLKDLIGNYAAIGVPVLFTSAASGVGISELIDMCREKTSAFLGASGTGKTSLLNRIFPGSNRAIGTVSESNQRGRHTTVFSEMLIGEKIIGIDTPGVRSFLPDIDENSLEIVYPEFEEPMAECAFSGCSHQSEPQCAVKEAVEMGTIPEERYRSYLRLREDIIDFKKRSGIIRT